jgi:hypothetical protein
MSNLYYSEQIPKRDMQRLQYSFNQYYLLFLAYNTSAGMFLVAFNNFLFRSRKATLPLALLASVTTYAMFAVNYHLSYNLMDRVFSHNVRRLGYPHLVNNIGAKYPRNVDYISH